MINDKMQRSKVPSEKELESYNYESNDKDAEFVLVALVRPDVLTDNETSDESKFAVDD